MRLLTGWLLACLCLFPMARAEAQPDVSRRTGITVADTGAKGYRFESLKLASADGARRYRLRIAVPERAIPGGHPLVWLLDGNAALMETDAALLERLAHAPRPPVIVYVAYDNDLRIDADARAFDYTPRRAGAAGVQRDVVAHRLNGGADDFLALLRGRALPEIARLAPLDLHRQALWGHSYGGVFVLHVLFTRPEAFARYAAVDPSLWWGEGHLLKPDHTQRQWPRPPPRVDLWVGQGGTRRANASPSVRDTAVVQALRQARRQAPPDAARQLAQRLREAGLPVAWRVLPGLDHGATLGASLPVFLSEVAESSASDDQARRQ
ncbi:alpha/beta hydrolase [Solilutibacter pythonis]|uniref:alpha/beta hydrolase n=1 Tax=Solilutibacter pythonis TaxID=2483112 RepID=UPI001314B632|nr:alpha/beta hydrolase-fold protein [Lysobacter pythonis]